MTYCDECANHNGWPKSAIKEYGECEAKSVCVPQPNKRQIVQGVHSSQVNSWWVRGSLEHA